MRRIYAKEVAAHLRTEHTEFYVEPKHALDLVPRMSEWFDEPFADSSQIPTLLISELTRQHVTVALSGDGGDELFAGYNRHLWVERFLRVAHAVPRRLHRPLAAILRALPPDTWSSLFQRMPFLPQTALAGDKLQKIATLFDDPSPDAIYRSLVSQWLRPEEIAAAGREPPDRSGMRASRRIFQNLFPACNFSISSLTFPTTSSQRLTGRRWHLGWRAGCRCSTIGSSLIPGPCRCILRSATARGNGCSTRPSIATCRGA